MMGSEFFILYGIKNNEIFYITNTSPIIWTMNLFQAKRYYDRYTAEYSILREYDNYRIVSDMIDHNILDGFFISSIKNNVEVWRYKLL